MILRKLFSRTNLRFCILKNDTRVATENAKSNSRTFLGHFPGLFQDCLRFFLQDLKFNFDYYSHAPTLLYL